MSPWPLTSAPAGATCCKSACSVSSRSGSFPAPAVFPAVRGSSRLHRRHGRQKPAQGRALRAVNILLALIQLQFAVQRGKKIAKLAHGLGGAQEEKTARVQRVVEQGNELLLQVPAHIDQEVAATDQVELGERRVFDHVLLGKDQHVADAFVDAIGAAAGLGREKPRQPLRRDVGGDAGRIEAGAGRGNRLAVNVGGEDLHLETLLHAPPGARRAGWRWNRLPRRWSIPATRRGSRRPRACRQRASG